MNVKPDRRSFLNRTSLLAGGAFSAQSIFNQAYGALFKDLSDRSKNYSALELAAEEDYRARIQQTYSASAAPMLNLNDGGVSPSPVWVQHAVEGYYQLSNQGPSDYVWRTLDPGREPESLKKGMILVGKVLPPA